jgi:hypothetical protein
MELKKKIPTEEEVIVRVEDVECPEADVVLANLTTETELIGRVKFLSDGARRADEFAIVEAAGLRVPLVVRVEKLRWLGSRMGTRNRTSRTPTELQ